MDLKFLLLFIPVFLFFSCKPNEEEVLCPDTVELGTLNLSDFSKNYLRYDESVSRVVFKNSNEAEVVFDFEYNRLLTIESWSNLVECPTFGGDSLHYIYNINTVSSRINCPELDLSFVARVKVIFNKNYPESGESAEIFNLDCLVPTEDPVIFEEAFNLMNYTVDEGTYPNYKPELERREGTLLEEVTLLDQTFTNVYFNNNFFGPLDEVYYTKEQGIVGFKYRYDGPTYVLDRIE